MSGRGQSTQTLFKPFRFYAYFRRKWQVPQDVKHLRIRPLRVTYVDQHSHTDLNSFVTFNAIPKSGYMDAHCVALPSPAGTSSIFTGADITPNKTCTSVCVGVTLQVSETLNFTSACVKYTGV